MTNASAIKLIVSDVDGVWTDGSITYLGELGGSLLRLHAGEAPGVRLRTEAESLVVPVDKAVPLGLVANEFVTNSFKYAFRGEPGTIGLELARAGAGK